MSEWLVGWRLGQRESVYFRISVRQKRIHLDFTCSANADIHQTTNGHKFKMSVRDISCLPKADIQIQISIFLVTQAQPSFFSCRIRFPRNILASTTPVRAPLNRIIPRNLCSIQIRSIDLTPYHLSSKIPSRTKGSTSKSRGCGLGDGCVICRVHTAISTVVGACKDTFDISCLVIEDDALNRGLGNRQVSIAVSDTGIVVEKRQDLHRFQHRGNKIPQ